MQGRGQALGWFGQTEDLALDSLPVGTGPLSVRIEDLSLSILSRDGSPTMNRSSDFLDTVNISEAWSGIPAGMPGSFEASPVVSLRSTTGGTLGCLRHTFESCTATFPRELPLKEDSE